jgi:hypothetical protein
MNLESHGKFETENICKEKSPDELTDILTEDPQKFYEELDRMSRENMKRLEKFEKRQRPLPEFLYHVTKKENVAQILREGIDLSPLYFDAEHAVVGLSDDIEFAIGVAEVTQGVNRNHLAVLKIDTKFLTPSRIQNHLREADPAETKPLDASAVHEVHYESVVPPEAIKIYDIKKEKNAS